MTASLTLRESHTGHERGCGCLACREPQAYRDGAHAARVSALRRDVNRPDAIDALYFKEQIEQAEADIKAQAQKVLDRLKSQTGLTPIFVDVHVASGPGRRNPSHIDLVRLRFSV